MKKKFHITIALSLVVLTLGGGGLLAWAQQLPAGGSLPAANLAGWTLAPLDATASQTVGKYTSIAIDPMTDHAYISYYDETNGDLKLAYPVSAGGNCGPKNAWLCEVVAGSGGVNAGRYASVAVYHSLLSRRVGIAYVEMVGQNPVLKYASFACQVLKPCNPWEYETVFSIGSVPPMYPSLKFDSTGEPHIAFYTPGYADPVPAINGALRYAEHIAPGDDGWLTTVVAQGATPPGGQAGDNQLGVGLYPSLAINSSDDPRIAFFASDYGNLLYAVYVGNNTGSCYNDDWDCQLVDDNDVNTGMFPSLYLASIYDQANTSQGGGGDRAYIAYYAQGSGYVRYATNTDLGGCGSNPNWYCTIVDEIGVIALDTPADFHARHIGLSLGLDAIGYPLIAYQMLDAQGPSSLKIGRPANAVGKFLSNCGPMAFWHCEWIHPAPDGNVNEADYVSLAVNSDGLATIAYSEDESWFNAGWHLRLAFQQFKVYLPLSEK